MNSLEQFECHLPLAEDDTQKCSIAEDWEILNPELIEYFYVVVSVLQTLKIITFMLTF